MIPIFVHQCRRKWRLFAFITLVIWALIATVLTLCSASVRDVQKVVILSDYGLFFNKYYSRPPVVTQEMPRQWQLQFKHFGLIEKVQDFRYEPPELYEIHKRRLYTNIIDLWHFIRSEIKLMVKYSPELTKFFNWQEFLEQIGNRKRSLVSDHNQMSELDGYHAWRQREACNVSDLIQRRLRYLQNPPDCRKANKVVCTLQKPCGFGCQLHHIIYCLVFAYTTERTLILDSHDWWYGDSNGWEFFFQPLSDTCTTTYGEKVSHWPHKISNDLPSIKSKVVSIPSLDYLIQKPTFLPLSLPKDLYTRIVRFNGDASSWWIGQLMKYVTRLQPWQQMRIEKIASDLNFKSPIVGMQIRRTDKLGFEAEFHSIAEYMLHVKNYFDKLEMTTAEAINERRVYLASDDFDVLEAAQSLYSEYTFLGNATISFSAHPKLRYSSASLEGLLVDLFLLSKCDFVVGTFSSQVGRVVYELMQGNRADASQSFYSLDDIYYFGGQSNHLLYAVLAHKGSTVSKRESLRGKMYEIDMEVGDAIHVLGNHLDGYGLGTNIRTKKHGLFPWYKTTDRMVLYPFPEYEKVPLYVDKTF